MTIVDFFKYNNLAGKIDRKQSKNCYNDSDDPIQWIPLSHPVDGQTYLVMSHTSATKYLNGEVDFKDLEVTHSDQGWGIVMPSNSVTVETIDLF